MVHENTIFYALEHKIAPFLYINKNVMRKIIVFGLVVFGLASCSPKVINSVEKKTEYIKDSIFIKEMDSIYVYMKNDTIYKDKIKYKYFYKDKIITDTIYKENTKIIKEKYIPQRYKYSYFIMITIIIGLIILILFKIFKKKIKLF